MLDSKDRRILINALLEVPAFGTLRGRQAIVSNALDGFPLSANIKGNLNLEGTPFVVAVHLVSQLDGIEPADGVPALARIVEAIELMSDAEQQVKLADLRRYLGRGAADLSSPPVKKWRDDRSAAVVQERIIGENTLLPMYYLRRALVAADAVVRVDVDGRAKGTGFLVAADLMMTNHHVIGDEGQARTAQVHFFDEVPDETSKGFRTKPRIVEAAASGALAYTNEALDVSLVRLQGAPPLNRYLPLRRVKVQQNNRVVIIQHPGGAYKQISLQNNLVAYADERIVQYYTSTEAGSSGSPVLDSNFAVVAVHHGWVKSKTRGAGAEMTEELHYRNEGTSVIAFLTDLGDTCPELASELTVVAG